MEDQANIDMINRYLRGELMDNEVSEVEKKILTDSDFRNLFLEMKSTEIAIKSEVMSEKMDMLKGLEVGYTQASTPDKPKSSRLLWITFVIAVLSALGVVVFNKLSDRVDTIAPPSMAEFSQYVIHEKVRSGENVKNIDKEKAYNLYVLREFELAIPMLQSLWENEKDSTALYYLGVSYHYTGQPARAKEIFENNTFTDYKIPK
jgi:hypothetical protein